MIQFSSFCRFFAGTLLACLPAALTAQQTITGTPGQVGANYSFQVTSTATPPVQYQATGLPAGLAINASSGLITGMPTTPGTSLGDVSVTSNGQTNHAAISITIVAASGTSIITSSTTANGTVGQAFSYTVTGSNAPTSFNVSGLPAQLVADTNTGAISGVPATAGTYSIALSGNNASGTGAPVTLTLTVAAPAAAPVITSPTSAAVAVGAPFSYTITATNTPSSFAAAGRPLGVDLDSATGALSGTSSIAGVYTMALTATNGNGTSAPVNLVLTVGSLPAITSATTVLASVGQPFSYATLASAAATSFNVSGLPPGLTATPAGVISGTPTSAGVFPIQLSANNTVGTGPSTTLTLTTGERPAITSASSASGKIGTAFSYQITATGTPTSYAAAGLPATLSLDAATGLISGTPTGTGTHSVSLTATNLFGAGEAKTLTIQIGSSGGGGGGGGGGGAGGGGGWPIILNETAVNALVGVPFELQIKTSIPAMHFEAVGLPEAVSLSERTGLISGTFTAPGIYNVDLAATNLGGTHRRMITITASVLPVFTLQPQGASVDLGAKIVLSGAATGTPTPTYQWLKNGSAIPGATDASFTIASFQAADAGSYVLVATNAGGSTSSAAAVLGVHTTAKVVGLGKVVGEDIKHPNGNTFDQVLITGTTATITADPGQITRMSYVDLDDDIVQIEFSGAGTVTVSLENATGPAVATKYNQPDITYMKGHASLVVSGVDETTYLSVFSVGTITAVNPTLFKPGETYDGMADIGLISISSRDGKMASLRLANASFFRAAGMTGINAPGVTVVGAIYVGELTADADAEPILVFGGTGDFRVTGGDLHQLNGRAVEVDGISNVSFTAGATSHGVALPAQANRAKFEKNGKDITGDLVPPPH
ncbi:putative Ig domain-containing protein [Opitutus terrae]|uniref:Immunoglobulin I-set domain protein n=1 Tax=Opitutus terrae (strain DSM 11246 / JCM 15787 / PB90-1) TaxID=452637 RepID=B1ZQC3_OPITP|nr:putative Ig domain-containing protein [Opitutus terrae]ACB73603.1 Immunoglobulin I-set domain protein [Opitutus terrae PB90-1]